MTFPAPLPQAERGDLRHYIIPLLHTLMYTLIQVSWACHLQPALGLPGAPSRDIQGRDRDRDTTCRL